MGIGETGQQLALAGEQGGVVQIPRRGAGRADRRLDARGLAGHDLDSIPEPERLERIVGYQQHRATREQRRRQGLEARSA